MRHIEPQDAKDKPCRISSNSTCVINRQSIWKKSGTIDEEDLLFKRRKFGNSEFFGLCGDDDRPPKSYIHAPLYYAQSHATAKNHTVLCP